MKHHTRLSIPALVTAGLLCVGSPAAADGPARLVADINRTKSYEMDSAPEQYHRLGDLTLFLAWTPDTGWEIWRTDGTEAGTFLLEDIWPGPSSGAVFTSPDEGSMPFDPAVANGLAFFVANDGVHGWELWRTDGMRSGTFMVKEIRPGTPGPFDDRKRNSSHPTLSWSHAEAGGLLYFAADDGDHGFELWRSDGTGTGTFLLQDIMPGPQGSFGARGLWKLSGFSAAAVGGALLFSADDGVNGSELWRSDGTPAGTFLLEDIIGGASSSPTRLMALDGSVLFWANWTGTRFDPWISDGTAAGTRLVAAITPGSVPGEMIQMNGEVYFLDGSSLFATDGTSAGTRSVFAFPSSVAFRGVADGHLILSAYDYATGYEPWVSDGTTGGTRLLKDIAPGISSSYPGYVVSAGGRVLFIANDRVHGNELWSSDLTEAGTSLLYDVQPGAVSGAVSLFESGGRCYLMAYDGGSVRLWLSDGTSVGTHPLGNVLLRSTGMGTAADGTLLFDGEDQVHGAELWRSDGTEEGTFLLKDLNPLVRTNDSAPEFLGVVSTPGIGGRMLFVAEDAVHGRELWSTDGTPQGTWLVKDIHPGTGGSVVPDSLVYKDVLYFVASDGMHGNELWRSDGTDEGTVMLADVNPGPRPGVSHLVPFKGEIAFAGAVSEYEQGIWMSDGTTQGTRAVVASIPAEYSWQIFELFPLGDTLYFVTYDADHTQALWKTDGTAPGTVMLTDDSNRDPFFLATGFVPLGNLLFFGGLSATNGYEPWVTDGTVAGTHMIKDIRPGYNGSFFSQNARAAMGGFVYFAAKDGANGEDLWRSDGTEAGTVRVKDLALGSAVSGIGTMAVLDDTLYFTVGFPGAHSRQLWKSDGTGQGTMPVVTGLDGFYGSLDVVAGGILLSVCDESHGCELWRSDGTAGGTVLVQDLVPGYRDSVPRGYAVMGDRVFFGADDLNAGLEPWVARSAILLGRPGLAIQDLVRDVRGLDLPFGVALSLTAKLDAAAQALSGGRTTEALGLLTAFAQEARASSPRWIAPAHAADLVDFAGEIADLLASTGPS